MSRYAERRYRADTMTHRGQGVSNTANSVCVGRVMYKEC